VVNITVKAGQEDAFEAAVKAHNEMYHGEGLYKARLAYELNGPDAGTYSWIMGPTNYTAMDSRPGKGAHDDDWAKVSAFVEEFGAPTYWSLDRELSSLQSTTGQKRVIWMYDIKSGQGSRWAELVGKVKKVYTEKRPTETFIVVWNEFADTKAGRDAAVIFGFDKWAWLDRDANFGADYEAVHGAGSWHNFLNEFNDTIDGRVDWMRSFVE
jgi:hypothetical protein